MTDPWRCAICHRTYVVPSMARDCEKRHNDLRTGFQPTEGPR